MAENEDNGAGTVVEDPDLLAGVYERLLVPSFPPDELIAAEQLLAEVAAGQATVRVVGDPAGPLAVAILERFDASPAVLLGYFATRADQRGRGVGTALLRGLLDGINADPDVSVVLAEVEHPGHHEPDDAHGDPAARLRFYGRLGGRILDLGYFQPPITDGSNPVFGMLLLVLDPAERWVRDGHLVPEAGVGVVMEEVFDGVDPALVGALVTDAAGPIRLFAPEDLEQVPVHLGPRA